MDEPTNKQFKIIWEVHPGDMVKIREYDWLTESRVYYYGVVVGDIEMDQLMILVFGKKLKKLIFQHILVRLRIMSLDILIMGEN